MGGLASYLGADSSLKQLVRLAGHLRGKAVQEWTLQGDSDGSTFAATTRTLGSRGGEMLAAQELHHTVQHSTEACS